MQFALTMPKMSPTMEEGTIAVWHKKEGDRIEAGDLLFEVATDKATVEYNALDEGWLRKIIVKDGGHAIVNQPVAILTEDADESFTETQEAPPKVAEATNIKEVPALLSTKGAEKPSLQEESSRIIASPLAKKIAKEKGLDLSQVKGSGPNKRVMSRDLEGGQASFVKPKGTLPSGSFTTEALSPIRKVIAERLQEAKSTIPHFYVEQIVDAESLVDFRQHLIDLGEKVSINDCIIKACALALKLHPIVNSGFNPRDNTIFRFQTIDISIAVSIPEGLITPIISHADVKGLKEISSEVKALVKRAKEGKLAPAEFQGGSFTVSNLGMYGVARFSAIINPPQAAILAVGGILETPVVKDGVVVPGKIMNLTLSSDHRVVDGAAAAQFLATLKRFIERPLSLLIS